MISRPEGYLISRREIGGPLRFLHGDNMIHLKILYVIEALLSHPDQDGIKYQLYQYLMQFFFSPLREHFFIFEKITNVVALKGISCKEYLKKICIFFVQLRGDLLISI